MPFSIPGSPTAEAAGRRGRVWRRLRRNRLALSGLAVLAAVFLAALLAPLLAPQDPFRQNFGLVMAGPSADRPLGSDQLGRDVLSRLLYGARLTLSVSFTATTAGLLLGALIGLLAGYYGGRIEAAAVWLTDLALAFPGMLLAIAVIAAVGPGLTSIIIAAAVYTTPQFVRLARGSVLVEKQKEYLAAAVCLGESDLSLLLRYLAPNILSPLAVMYTIQLANIVLIASGLSFLGLGAQPPSPEWGAMLSQGRAYLQVAPHISLFPGLAIMLVALALNLFGDGLRDALDPRQER